MSEQSLKPAWDAEPDRSLAGGSRECDLYATAGISNLRGVARFTIAGLVFYIILRIFGLFGSLVEPGSHYESGMTSVGTSLFGMAGLLGWGVGLLLTFCLIPGFLMWLVGAANNSQTISNSRLGISPGWQAAMYFAPFFHLIVPAVGMQQILSRSHLPHPDRAFLYLLLWWFTWTLGTFGVYLARLQGNPDTDGTGYTPYLVTLDVTAAVLTSTSALFLIALIHIVTKSQVTFARANPLSHHKEIEDDQVSA